MMADKLDFQGIKDEEECEHAQTMRLIWISLAVCLCGALLLVPAYIVAGKIGVFVAGIMALCGLGFGMYVLLIRSAEWDELFGMLVVGAIFLTCAWYGLPHLHTFIEKLIPLQ